MTQPTTSETDAYCPTCEQELAPEEYSDTDGHQECGTTDLWLSEDAFLRINNSEPVPR